MCTYCSTSTNVLIYVYLLYLSTSTCTHICVLIVVQVPMYLYMCTYCSTSTSTHICVLIVPQYKYLLYLTSLLSLIHFVIKSRQNLSITLPAFIIMLYTNLIQSTLQLTHKMCSGIFSVVVMVTKYLDLSVTIRC